MELSLERFQPLTLGDKPVFDAYYQRFPPVHSDYVFTTMISWQAYGNYSYALVNDHLVISSVIGGKRRFRPPIGEYNLNIMKQVLELAVQEGADDPFGVINEETKTWLVDQFPRLQFVEHRDYFDYVYRASDLATLPGGDYRKIRNRLNKFQRLYSYSVEDITKENLEECKEFLHRWCLWKDCDSDVILENEVPALNSLMRQYNVPLLYSESNK